jgi:hypothetical protein
LVGINTLPNSKVTKFMQRSTLFWDLTPRGVAITYRRFGTTYRSNFQGSSIFWIEIPEKRKSHLHSGGSLKLCYIRRHKSLFSQLNRDKVQLKTPLPTPQGTSYRRLRTGCKHRIHKKRQIDSNIRTGVMNITMLFISPNAGTCDVMKLRNDTKLKV